ncbi:hypothetical protein BSKO_09768 [Bryopsis sp. KO-2023]|nr:hypothetical protein BSKO_09768 [Bryopsis sp. KO-2023]
MLGNPSKGTVAPHFKSLVIHLGFNPSLIQALVTWTQFELHPPALQLLRITSGSSCQTARHLGSINSVGFNTAPQLSHRSPPVSKFFSGARHCFDSWVYPH